MTVNCSMKGDLDCCGTLTGKIYAPTWVTAYELAVQEGFEGTEEEWLASLHGADGKDGKSAYELAVEAGFQGTLDEWLDSLSAKHVQHGDLEGRYEPDQHPIEAIEELEDILDSKADVEDIPEILTATYQDIMDAYDIWAKGAGVKS